MPSQKYPFRIQDAAKKKYNLIAFVYFNFIKINSNFNVFSISLS